MEQEKNKKTSPLLALISPTQFILGVLLAFIIMSAAVLARIILVFILRVKPTDKIEMHKYPA